MDARMVTLTATPGHLDALTGFWDDSIVTQLTDQAGNRGFILLKDVANDGLTAVSLWDSDADATGPTLRSHLASIVEHLAAPANATVVQVVAAAGAFIR